MTQIARLPAALPAAAIAPSPCIPPPRRASRSCGARIAGLDALGLPRATSASGPGTRSCTTGRRTFASIRCSSAWCAGSGGGAPRCCTRASRTDRCWTWAVGGGSCSPTYGKLGTSRTASSCRDTAAWHARNVLRLPVATGDFVKAPPERDRYNAIIFWHSLEHFSRSRRGDRPRLRVAQARGPARGRGTQLRQLAGAPLRPLVVPPRRSSALVPLHSALARGHTRAASLPRPPDRPFQLRAEPVRALAEHLQRARLPLQPSLQPAQGQERARARGRELRLPEHRHRRAASAARPSDAGGHRRRDGAALRRDLRDVRPEGVKASACEERRGRKELPAREGAEFRTSRAGLNWPAIPY